MTEEPTVAHGRLAHAKTVGDLLLDTTIREWILCVLFGKMGWGMTEYIFTVSGMQKCVFIRGCTPPQST